MDNLKDFDVAAARAIIDAFMIKHGQTDQLPPNSMYVTDAFEELGLRVKPDDSATYTTFRLHTQDEDADAEEEVTLYTVGVLTQKLLPPFKPKRRYAPFRDSVFKGFRQSVTLHGAGAQAMVKAVQVAKYGCIILDRHVAKATAFPSERVSVDNFVVANPYFETGEDAKGKEKVSFPKHVDPFDDLNRMQTEGCQHTEDNVVQYLEGFENEEGVFKQVPITPARFRPGDVVRVGFAICVKQDNAHNSASSDFVLVLRSITLIDDTISTTIAMKQLDEPNFAAKKRTTVTRRALAEDIDERPMTKVRKAMSKLSIRGNAMHVDNSQGEGSSGAQ